MTEPTRPPAPLTLDALARRVGRYCWIEMRAFEALGSWTATVPEPDITALLATHSRQRAWHAELWHDLLPVIGEAAPERFVEPGHAAATFATALAALPADDDPATPAATISRLAGAYRVLAPRMVAAYQRHLATTSPVADAPTTRVLRLVLADQLDHWLEGEAALQGLLHSAADVERAAATQVGLESTLVATGDLGGG